MKNVLFFTFLKFVFINYLKNEKCYTLMLTTFVLNKHYIYEVKSNPKLPNTILIKY